jgi:hypothetical protein
LHHFVTLGALRPFARPGLLVLDEAWTGLDQTALLAVARTAPALAAARRERSLAWPL